MPCEAIPACWYPAYWDMENEVCVCEGDATWDSDTETCEDNSGEQECTIANCLECQESDSNSCYICESTYMVNEDF